MKNKLLSLTALALGSFGLIASVNAAGIAELVSGGFASQEEEGVYKLSKSTQFDLEIEANEKIVLDLGGQNFTSENPANSAIHVKTGGELTIKDTGNNGVITYRSDATQNANDYAPVINNAGTLNFDGGKVTASKGAAGHPGTGIYNTGTLNFNGGEVENTVNYCYGITNEGIAYIKDGKITQGAMYTAVINNKNLYISGGEFKANGDGYSSLVSNTNTNDGEDKGKGAIEVTGGTFDSKKVFHGNAQNTETHDDIVVTAGKFIQDDANSNVQQFLAENYELTAEGEVVTDADYEEYNAVLEEAENKVKETDKYTEESIKALQSAIDEAKELAKNLKSNEQDKIDNAVQVLKTAINGLKLIPTPSDKTDEENKEENNKDNEESNKKPDEGKTPETTPGDDTPTKNPNTYDGIMNYVIMAISALGTISIASKKILNK